MSRTQEMLCVERLERCLEVELPTEYREFVLAGMPWDERRVVLHWGPGGDYPFVVIVQRPYPVEKGRRGDATIEFMVNLHSERRVGDGLIPEDAIAVAGCGTQEEILLFVRGYRRGQVWLKEWRRLEEADVDDAECGVHFVALNFREFLDLLKAPQSLEPDLAARVFVYVPDPARSLFSEFDNDDVDDVFTEPFAPAQALAASGEGEWVGLSSPDEEDPYWRFGFEGTNSQRMADVLIAAFKALHLPPGSYLLIDNDPSRRMEI